MPAYQFIALEADGKTRKGIIEADTARGARSSLRSQSLIPLEVNAVVGVTNASAKSQGIFAPRRIFNNTGLTVWTRQLAGLVGSGLPLERALTALVDESEGEAQRDDRCHLPCHRQAQLKVGEDIQLIRDGIDHEERDQEVERFDLPVVADAGDREQRY